jgi:hypothetical protein
MAAVMALLARSVPVRLTNRRSIFREGPGQIAAFV